MRSWAARFLAIAIFSSSLVFIQTSPAYATGDTIFTSSFNSGVKGRAINGTGTQRNISSVSAAVELEASGGFIYSSYGGIRRMATDGSGLTTLRTISGQQGIVISGSFIYYGYEYTRKIGRMNLDGTGANDSWLDYSSNSNAPFSGQLVVVDGFLYFGGGNNSYGTSIWKVAVGGGTPTHFMTDADAQAGINGIDSDGTFIYWTDFRVGEIGRVALDLSSTNDNWVTGLSSPWGIQVADDYVYFNNSSSIGRILRNGSGLERTWVSNSASQGLAIADAGVNSTSLAVTATNVNFFALASNSTTALFRTPVTVSINVTVAARVTFMANGKRIGGCINRETSGTSPSIIATCSWSPSTRGSVTLTALIDPINENSSNLVTSPLNVRVGNRTTTR